MSITVCLEIVAYLLVLIILSVPIGWFISRVFRNLPCGLDPFLRPVEKTVYWFCGVNPVVEMNWQHYTASLLVLNLLGASIVYALQRCQLWLPFNPDKVGNVAPDLALNTAISFATNTNWQAYSGESTMSHLTQMLGLTVQNFVSAATGISVVMALTRGLTRRTSETIGNFWTDITRSILFVLLPLSCLLATVLVFQGVVQSFSPATEVNLIEPVVDKDGNMVKSQMIPLGPAASQIAIKQLGTNGGGYFGVNSAHPLENPNPLTNFLEMVAILLIPAALCFSFGEMVNDRRQGIAIFAAMSGLFIPFLAMTVWAELSGNPRLDSLNVEQGATPSQSGGNMEGKETRFGAGASALWATATTAASNGSVNAMHDSFTPLGGLGPLALMQLGEVVFGGVGSGLYGILIFAILSVFIAGLMVGRTPEYLGKKIESYEMKMAALVILIPPLLVLVGTAIAVSLELGTNSVTNPGPHGFSQILYAFSSAGNNNGSAFAGLGVNTLFYNLMLGVAMLASRFWLIIPVLAIAGSLAKKKLVPPSAGTLPTHTPLFVSLLMGMILLVGALTFVPALALGPIAEQMQLISIAQQ